MYKSPIELIRTQMNDVIENEIYQAVIRVGVNVDKDELLKALTYDREQYRKGYQDGRADGESESRGRGVWIRQDNTYSRFMCSNCYTKNHNGSGRYCSNCGAKMTDD